MVLRLGNIPSQKFQGHSAKLGVELLKDVQNSRRQLLANAARGLARRLVVVRRHAGAGLAAFACRAIIAASRVSA